MGITFDPSCIAAGQKALAEFGTGTTGSRIANGSFAMHKELERELAAFKRKEAALLFPSGYAMNVAQGIIRARFHESFERP